MEFVFIIIVVVIISVISAATKKKPKSSGQPDVPPRPMMSDIQRAFMMAAGLPDEHPQQPSAPVVPSAPASSYNPTYAPYVPPDQPTAVSVAPAVAESYEGLTARNVVRPVVVPSASPFAGVQVGAYFIDDEEPKSVKATPVQQSPIPHAAPLALFENQQDIVKAFIYAEILPRRGSVPHIR